MAKYKTLDRVQWLQRAVSKDSTRYNLQAIYRDSTTMVATDGHRMHLVEHLPSIPTPHFIDASDDDMTFPDYKQVLPKGSGVGFINLKPSALPLKLLNHAVKLLNIDQGKNKSIVVLSRTDKGILLSAKSSMLKIEIPIELDSENTIIDARFKIGFNLSYLLDAITDLPEVRINFHGELNPIDINYTLFNGENYRAIIMPCRV